MKEVLALLPLLDKLARRRFWQHSLAEEASTFVLEELSRNNWQRMRAFGDKGSFQGFFTQVCLRLLEDFARKRFGRPRPPHHIRCLGPVAVRLYTLLCLEGYTPDDATAITSQEVPGLRDLHLLRQHINTILRTVHDCGVRHHEIGLDQMGEMQDSDKDDPTRMPPEQSLLVCEEQAILEALRHWRTLELQPEEALDTPAAQKVRQALREVVLDDEERILLQWVYEDGMKVSEAGRLLGLNAAQAHGRLRRLLERVRSALEAVLREAP